MERMIGSIGKLSRKVDWIEKQIWQIIGSEGKLGYKVDMTGEIERVIGLTGKFGIKVHGANDKFDR